MHSGSGVLPSISSATSLANTDIKGSKSRLRVLLKSSNPTETRQAGSALAWLLSVELDYSGALEVVQALLHNFPNASNVLNNEALLYLRLGKFGGSC